MTNTYVILFLKYKTKHRNSGETDILCTHVHKRKDVKRYQSLTLLVSEAW